MSNEDVSRRLGLEGGDFYVTSPAPCPYLKGKEERKVFSYLNGPSAPSVNSMLTRRGFRRSQNIIYLPACEGCSACQPVRIVVDDFDLSKSRRRILSRNGDVTRRLRAPRATSEQFSILRGYLDDRHAAGGMADMTVLDYASMVEETAVDTLMVEYRNPSYTDDLNPNGRLIACALTDRLTDGLSMVYSFFEPDEAARRPWGLHDPRSHCPRRRSWIALRLSRLLGQRLGKDGLQTTLPAAGKTNRGRLGSDG